MFLGSHIGLSGPGYYLSSVQTALDYGENTFMFYTGAPQNTLRKPLDSMKIAEGREFLRANGIDESKLVVHAPYIINLANKDKESTFSLAKEFLVAELRRTEAFGVSRLVLHPGSHVGLGVEHGMESLLLGLDEVLSQDGTKVTVCLETMSGKGSEVGVNLEFFQEFLSRFSYSSRIGICLDTCHMNDAGYDVSDASALLDEFDRVLGLSRLQVVHLNDSKNVKGAHKDRHENIGYGTIGFKALHSFVVEPRLAEIPIILETPYIGEKAPYQQEISMLRQGRFDSSWREKLI